MIIKEVLKPVILVFLVFACLFAAIIGVSRCANRAAERNMQATATSMNMSATRQAVTELKTRNTAVARRATREAQPTSTPRPPTATPEPVKITIKGLGVTRRDIKIGMQEVGFVFNPQRTTPYQSLYGSSTHQTFNGSVAQIEIFGSATNIRKVEFKAFDIDIEPSLGAAHTLMVFSLMFPEWEDAAMAQWVADATGRALDGDVVKHRRSVRGGYAQIELFIRGTTLFVDVEVE